MFTPRKMKYIEMTVFKNDMNAVLEFLGKAQIMHFGEPSEKKDSQSLVSLNGMIENLRATAEYANIDLSHDAQIPQAGGSFLPGEEDEAYANRIVAFVREIKERNVKFEQEKMRLSETLNEAKAFSQLNVPFSQLDQLSFLALRIGVLDPKGQEQLRENLGDRAVIIRLNDKNKVLAASSRKGRFALDSQLKKVFFEPVKIPDEFVGVPSDLIESLENNLARINETLENFENEKENFRNVEAENLCRLYRLFKNALLIEEIKSTFTATENFYHFSGWMPSDETGRIVKEITELTKGRVAVKTYSPEEVPSVANGKQKVPVFMKHGAFVKGFEGVVFSYGSPLYGTIDPTPLVAFFFTILFGIMFGDVGQGLILLLAGILIKKIPALFEKFSKFSTPLVSIGISSMVFGLLFGAVFTNENLLVPLTRKITTALTGNPMDRIIFILPLEETGGSLTKMMYFFAFTIGIGVILISTGLLINIINRIKLKKYEEAFFSRTGLAGFAVFFYAIFIAVRILLGGSFAGADIAGLVIPVILIFFGPVIWRIIARKRPVLEHGFMAFFMEGFVGILETISGYVSNTVSFLRVGAFALSHSVLSFIVFTFSSLLHSSGAAGSVSALLIMIIGNAIIIVLEGMIVAIQVIRLQYYEFFNKFFVETGVEFSPFRIGTRR